MSRPEVLRACALLVLGLAQGLTAAADAQVFAGVGDGAGLGVTMPEAPKPPPAPTAPALVLRHLPSTLDGLELIGESGELRWPVYLTAAQAAGALRLRIGYKSAVSVLPEASTLTAQVNDRTIGTDVIDAPRGLRIVELDLPAGLLRPGFNAIVLSVRQRHRVDCSVVATYELWTRIEPAETGLVLPADARAIANAADLPALLPRADGTLPIHILLHGRTSPRNVERLVRATGAVALAARALQPVVDFDAGASGPEGVDLAVGPRAALAADPRFSDALGTDGPLLRALPPTGPLARPTLIATGSTDAEVDAAVASIGTVVRPEGSEQGLAAARAYPATRTAGGESIMLRDLGMRSEEFSGRFLRKSFNLDLPADFLAADYGRGTFDLAGGYAAGLARGSQVRVDINGKSSGVIKLPYAGGDVFRHNQLFLPLSLMRPGLNRIDVYAETPRPEDATCEAPEAKRFLFTDTSRIVLPTLAHVQRLPDLAETAAGALPYAQGHARLVVPTPDRETMGSALSLTARAAVAAGKVIPFAFAMKMGDATEGSTLVVAPARALDPAVMHDLGLDPAEVEAAWRETAERPPSMSPIRDRWWLARGEGPAACRLPSTARLAAPTPQPAADASAEPAADPTVTPVKADDGDLLETWSQERHPRRDWLAPLRSAASGARAWAASWGGTWDASVGKMRERLASRPDSDGVAPEASLILAQGIAKGSKDAVTTIVTAPTAAMLHAAIPCLADPRVWSQLRGRLAVLDASKGVVTTTDATSFRYVAARDGSLANSRLVLAGWFSLDPLAFVGVAMLLALMLSATTLWFVRGVGRRPE